MPIEMLLTDRDVAVVASSGLYDNMATFAPQLRPVPSRPTTFGSSAAGLITTGGRHIVPFEAQAAEALQQVDWLNVAFADLASVENLASGWDSYSASAISPNAVAASRRALTRLAFLGIRRPAIVPRSDGGIQLEWHTPLADLELTLWPDGTCSVYGQDPARPNTVEFGPASVDAILALVS